MENRFQNRYVVKYTLFYLYMFAIVWFKQYVYEQNLKSLMLLFIVMNKHYDCEGNCKVKKNTIYYCMPYCVGAILVFKTTTGGHVIA